MARYLSGSGVGCVCRPLPIRDRKTFNFSKSFLLSLYTRKLLKLSTVFRRGIFRVGAGLLTLTLPGR